MNYTVFSTYTPKSIYEKDAHTLKLSCKKFNVPCVILPQKDTKIWVENTMMKPSNILSFMEHTDVEAVWWLDADAELLNHPQFFWCVLEEKDFAVFSMGSRSRVCSGTLGFKNTPKVRDFVTEWAEECEKCKDRIGDQHCLRKLIKNGGYERHKICRSSLPYSYCYVFDGSLEKLQPKLKKPEKIVVLHKQSSRKAKRR
jgi:hypothetical protein